jgi:glucose-fructose oxidoreductase
MQGNHQGLRYAVVGLGHIAQAAVLPAFKHAKQNSELTALVSDDQVKLQKLGRRYKVRHLYSYEDYDACLDNEQVDAVYIALPNHLHCEYTVRACKASKHVLCEKPMAVTEAECRQMIDAAQSNRVKLMIAYRLHFEEANLRAIELLHAGEIGDPRLFDSCFTMQVKEGDIRLRRETGGGTLWDIGIYCINAARYLFRDEPLQATAFSANSGDERFSEVDESTSAVLRFPNGRLAAFTCSFGAGDVSSYRVVGTEGDLRVDPAYEYAGKLAHHRTREGKTKKQTFAKRDQFAAELLYFSQCVQEGRDPQPSGWEGLADVRIIEALYRSAAEGKAVDIEPVPIRARPSLEQEIERPAVSEPELVHAESPTI